MVQEAARNLAVSASEALDRCAFREHAGRCRELGAFYPVATWSTKGGTFTCLMLGHLPHCALHKEIADATKLPLGAIDWNALEPQIRRLDDLPDLSTLELYWHDRPYLTCSFCGTTTNTHAEHCVANHFHEEQQR